MSTKPSGKGVPTQTTRLNNARGFSLVEILITLFLIAMIGYLVVSNLIFDSNQMDEALDSIERAMRFSVNETAVRGSIIRINFDLSSSPVKYTIEHGPKQGLVLPSFQQFDEQKGLSLLDQERKEKLANNLNRNFTKIDEFQDGMLELPEEIKIIAMASDLRSDKLLMEEESAQIYFYPTGEKDNAIIVLANDEEVATIEMFPFTEDIAKNYYKLDPTNFQEVEDQQYDKAKEIHGKWVSAK